MDKHFFTPSQIFFCTCRFYLRLQSYVYFHKSYPLWHREITFINTPVISFF